MNCSRNSIWLRRCTTLSLVGAISLAAPLMAAEHAEEEHHVQESHVHGLASLFVVLYGKELQVELESPAMNIVGFEHAPHSAEQRQQVGDVHQQLTAAQQLFYFYGGQCQLETVDVDMPTMIAEVEHEHEAEHHENEHQEHDEHTQHESEESGHEEDPETGSKHSDVFAKYLFNCQQPEMLTRIDVALINSFSGIEELRAQWVVRAKQGAKTLSPDDSSIELQ